MSYDVHMTSHSIEKVGPRYCCAANELNESWLYQDRKHLIVFSLCDGCDRIHSHSRGWVWPWNKMYIEDHVLEIRDGFLNGDFDD